MEPTVLVSQQGAIATLTFNRPAVFNAMNPELILAMREALAGIAQRPGVRALVIAGAGKAFLAGGDVGDFHRRLAQPGNGLVDTIKTMGDALHDGIEAIRNAPFPVIAKVHGAAAGAGFSLVLACDFAIASTNATFTSAYTRIGTSPDGGSTYFLPRLVGMKKAAELIMLSDTLTAEAALANGLINRVVAAEALDTEAQALAERLALGPTAAYAQAKQLLNRAFDRPIRAHLDEEIARFAECTRTADFREGVTAFVGKRAAEFKGY
ncbi:MAG: enoyl-CoA hydratase/isomerase family protein [Betaproteobacteria bacterium]|nr:enoyl-CoA hydratase/isomerase family protein [Betaproteobacteria bacterium]